MSAYKPKTVKFILNYILIAAFSLVFLGACGGSKSPDRAEVVNKIRSASKLATVEYVVTKVISSKKKHFLSRDSYFFAETEATIKAGIDLNKLNAEDITINSRQIQVELPSIELINFSYPADGFHVVEDYTYNDFWMKWKNFSIEEKDKLYRMGEEDIRSNISNLGITETARKNTRRLLRRILENSGFEEIYISFKEQPGDAVISDLREQIESIKNQLN